MKHLGQRPGRLLLGTLRHPCIDASAEHGIPHSNKQASRFAHLSQLVRWAPSARRKCPRSQSEAKICGRYGDAFDEHHFLERWAFARPHDARVGPQLAPTDPVTVIDGSGARVARWGLLPHAARSLKEAKRGSKINAPVEALRVCPRSRVGAGLCSA
jgi:hypothetical protein